jgi:NAD(P)-dependent dehydrogenase (short-subunit alcohol dehydrogenase family)
MSHIVAAISGGASGIGRATAMAFSRLGAKVAVIDHNIDAARAVALTLPGSEAFACDVRSEAAVEACEAAVRERLGAASVLCNIAGITKDSFMATTSQQAFEDVLAVNLTGTFLMTKHFTKSMPKGGAVVNVSSIVGKTGNAGQANYAASKAGVIGMTKTMALELARKGIRCNVVLPGFVETPMITTVPQKVIESILKNCPLGRTGKPEEIAHAIVFLSQNTYITGASLEVTGGLGM